MFKLFLCARLDSGTGLTKVLSMRNNRCGKIKKDFEFKKDCLPFYLISCPKSNSAELNFLFRKTRIRYLKHCKYMYFLLLHSVSPPFTSAILHAHLKSLFQASPVCVQFQIRRILLALRSTIFCPTTVLPLPCHPDQGGTGLRPTFSRTIHMFGIEVELESFYIRINVSLMIN